MATLYNVMSNKLNIHTKSIYSISYLPKKWTKNICIFIQKNMLLCPKVLVLS